MPKKILLIDDDEEICEEMSEILREEGYAVEITFDGLEGKKLMEKNSYNYDLLLLDMKLPGMGGLEILRIVKAEKRKPKVFIVTGKPLQHKKEKFFDDQEEEIMRLADGFMNKPFDVPVMLNKVRELIGNPYD